MLSFDQFLSNSLRYRGYSQLLYIAIYPGFYLRLISIWVEISYIISCNNRIMRLHNNQNNVCYINL